MKEQRFTRWQRIGLRPGLLREESYARRGTDVTGPGFVLGFLGAICGVCVLICLVVLAIAICSLLATALAGFEYGLSQWIDIGVTHAQGYCMAVVLWWIFYYRFQERFDA